jgi:hypothetical protein
MSADSAGGDEQCVRVSPAAGQSRLDPPPEGCAGIAVRTHCGTKNQDRDHPAGQCQISHRKQSGRRYTNNVLCGPALGVGPIQGIGLNPRGTHMRFVSTRWSLSAAGLITAFALAACQSPPPPAPPPAPPPPVVTTAPPMPPPVVHHRHHGKKHHHSKKHRKQ